MKLILILISMSGLLFGYFLAKITEEEMINSYHYFIFLKKILYLFPLGLAWYIIYQKHTLISLSIILILSSILLFFLYTIEQWWVNIISYVFLMILFLFISEHFLLLFASLIFLDGLITGTLIQTQQLLTSSLFSKK